MAVELPHAYRVLRADDTLVGGAADVPSAVTIMGSYYIREAIFLRVLDATDAVLAAIGESPHKPDAILQPLLIEVDELNPSTFSFVVHGVYQQAQLNFRDGSDEVELNDETPVEHTFESPGSYRVLATEGPRHAELLLTIFPPAE